MQRERQTDSRVHCSGNTGLDMRFDVIERLLIFYLERVYCKGQMNFVCSMITNSL